MLDCELSILGWKKLNKIHSLIFNPPQKKKKTHKKVRRKIKLEMRYFSSSFRMLQGGNRNSLK